MLSCYPPLSLILGALATCFAGLTPSQIPALGQYDSPPGVYFYQVVESRQSFSSVIHTSKVAHQKIQAITGTRMNSRSVAAILGAHQRQVGGFGYENISSLTAYGTQYYITVLWNSVPVRMILDTASSDTWAVPSTFRCFDVSSNEVPQDSCGFGPLYDWGFQYGRVSPEEHMYIRYGDGQTVTGPMGYSDISVGNLTIKKQQVCLANTTYWRGNNITTGLIGLGYPALTSAFTGADGDSQSPANQVEYSPVFKSMIDQGLVVPFFTVAVSRNSSGGVIAFGSTPYISGLDYTTVAYLPILITRLSDNPRTAYEYSFYTIVPDGWKWDMTTDLAEFPFIIDTGTTLCYLPPRLALAINQAFKPPGVYLWMYGAYFTSCTARAPTVAVILNKTPFFINPMDLIYRNLKDPLTGLCMTGIANGGSGPYILGDVFMQNVMATYDIGKSQMRFTGRQYYN
ncbi:acid protease [Thozetella sp. PMI_491]|nr:acid protease [Thozetella sp. PMI_491]